MALRPRRFPDSGAPPAQLPVLSYFEIAAATLADTALAMSFFFSFGTSVTTAGIVTPLSVVAPAIARRGRIWHGVYRQPGDGLSSDPLVVPGVLHPCLLLGVTRRDDRV